MDSSRPRRALSSYHTQKGVSTRIMLSVVASLMSFLLDFSPQRIELPKVSLRDKSWRYNDYVKPHQVISLSIIATSCENENGTPMTPSNRYEVVKICLFGNVEGTEKLVTRYATPSEQVAQEMEAWMAQFQFSNLFLENTQAILNIHKQALEAAGLRVRIRPV